MQLLGKVALVTGGGVGIGRAIALKLARRGCNIGVNFSRSKDEAEATVDEISKLGVKAAVAQANITQDAIVRGMVRRFVADFGRLDILINNAGINSVIPHQDLEAVKEEDWEKVLLVNLRGPFYAIRAALPALKASRGVIVNISAAAATHPISHSIPFCAAKAGLNNMTVAMAAALAPEIRVNAVAPGFVETRGWTKRPDLEKIKKEILARTLLQRPCLPDDIANAVVDLVENDSMTGQVVTVDAGSGIVR